MVLLSFPTRHQMPLQGVPPTMEIAVSTGGTSQSMITTQPGKGHGMRHAVQKSDVLVVPK